MARGKTSDGFGEGRAECGRNETHHRFLGRVGRSDIGVCRGSFGGGGQVVFELRQHRLLRLRQTGGNLADPPFLQRRHLSGGALFVFHRLETCEALAGTDEETGERVVIALGDCIELVIVATSARHRHSDERFGHHVDAVVDPFIFILARVHRRVNFLAEKRPAGSEDGFVETLLPMQTRFFHQVARDVLTHKRVIRHVGIQCANDVVPIFVGIRDDEIALVPARLRIADKVQPMSRPTLAELRRGEQLIHHPRPRVGGTIVEKRGDLLG